VPNFRFRAIIDIDVQNADSEASAREKAFSIMSAANAQPSRGRTPSGPKASVTGIAIEDNQASVRERMSSWVKQMEANGLTDVSLSCRPSGTEKPVHPETEGETQDVTE